MNAARFWAEPGVPAALERAGLAVLAPDRPRRPPSWHAEADHLAAALPDRPVTLVAGSNGCSAAVRLALAHPRRIARVLFAWPATAGDAAVDSRTRAGLVRLGASPATVRALLAGATLRGVSDAELAGLRSPVGVLPSVPENPFHQRRTVDALLRLLPEAEELPGCPEPLRPDFAAHLERFAAAVVGFVRS